MSKLLLQRILLALGIIALLSVIVDGSYSIAATIPGPTPVHVVHTNAGPYPLTVNLYKYPANAGFAVPFATVPDQSISGPLTFRIESQPGEGVSATPVRATFTTTPNVRTGIQGAAEITVKGPWLLVIRVQGSAGQASVSVPVTATALPPLPTWLGWIIGFIPFYVLGLFFLAQRIRSARPAPAVSAG